MKLTLFGREMTEKSRGYWTLTTIDDQFFVQAQYSWDPPKWCAGHAWSNGPLSINIQRKETPELAAAALEQAVREDVARLGPLVGWREPLTPDVVAGMRLFVEAGFNSIDNPPDADCVTLPRTTLLDLMSQATALESFREVAESARMQKDEPVVEYAPVERHPGADLPVANNASGIPELSDREVLACFNGRNWEVGWYEGGQWFNGRGFAVDAPVAWVELPPAPEPR